MIYHDTPGLTLHLGDVRHVAADLAPDSIDCIVTSPPYYGLRDYGSTEQIGAEPSPAEYADTLRDVFGALRPALRPTATVWLNLGDSYSGIRGNRSPAPQTKHRHVGADTPTTFRGKGSQRKNLLGIPWLVARTLQDDGWLLRNAIAWHKPNGMPTSARDRLANKYETVFLFTATERYHFDLDAIKNENGANPGDVWSIPTKPYPGAHFATFPVALAARCVEAGCPVGGTVLDPFSGAATTGIAATGSGRRYVGIDVNPAYHNLALGRLGLGAA